MTPGAGRNHQRNITWFNPPYSKNVKTNVGKHFLSLINHHFPKSNPLHKIFNRNTLKLSYSCMSNIKTIISNHNKGEISKSSKPPEEAKINCNCRNKNSCHMYRNCNEHNIVYQGEVITSDSRETSEFATLRSNYDTGITCALTETDNTETQLNSANTYTVWHLKDKKIDYLIKWRKGKRAKSYSNINKKCNLCLWEKYFIICRLEMSSLNSRDEQAILEQAIHSECLDSWRLTLLPSPSRCSHCRTELPLSWGMQEMIELNDLMLDCKEVNDIYSHRNF